MSRVSISFLIAATNEEKSIGKVMDNLARLRKAYPNIEVLAAVDGSTDRTEEIIKSYKFAKIIIRGPRLGKNISIFRLTQIAKGEIIVVHDADWLFVWSNRKLKNMITFFKENPDVGGIVQSVSYFNRKKYMKDPARFILKIGFIGEAIASNIIRETMQEMHKDKNFENLKFTPLLFIIRGKIINKKSTIKEEEICDEAKRTQEVMSKGYKVFYSDCSLPYFEVLYSRTSFNDLVKQRVRGFLSNRIQSRMYGWDIIGFYFQVFFSFFKKLFKLNTQEMVGLSVWVLTAVIAVFKVKTGLVKDKRVWAHRVERRDA